MPFDNNCILINRPFGNENQKGNYLQDDDSINILQLMHWLCDGWHFP